MCFELLRAFIAHRGPDTQFRIYLDRMPLDDFPVSDRDAEIRVLPARRFWTERVLAGDLRSDPPSVFYSATTQIPFLCRCPRVATVLDLAFFDFGEYFTWRRRVGARAKTRLMMHSVASLMAISEATKQDVIRRFGVSPETLTVAPMGVSEEFRPCSAKAIADVRAKYSLPERFILYVGQLQPRKNLVRLMQAFEKLCLEQPDLPHHLVLIGKEGWLFEPIYEAARASRVKDRIHFLGYLEERDELPVVMSTADTLALVSLWEGFGLPLAEAMRCGTTVIASNCSSMPEVVGDAGILVDPNSVDAIAAGLRRILTDDAFRIDLAQKGLERAKRFTWTLCAKRTMGVLRAVAEGRPPNVAEPDA